MLQLDVTDTLDLLIDIFDFVLFAKLDSLYITRHLANSISKTVLLVIFRTIFFVVSFYRVTVKLFIYLMQLTAIDKNKLQTKSTAVAPKLFCQF